MLGLASIAAAFVATQAAQLQMAMAANMARMNADSQSSVVKLLDAGQQNLNSLANVASGVGTNLHIVA
jgi:hypothetical protein